MSTANVNYKAVLADLEARKAQIESAITAVKTILASAGVITNGSSEGVVSPENIPPGTFHRLSIADATKKFLDMVKVKQGVPQIIQALERGGLPPAKYNTVYAVLRRRESQFGDLIRIGDEWALSEWYPNNPNLRKRNQEKPKAKGKAKKKPASKKAIVRNPSPEATVAPPKPAEPTTATASEAPAQKPITMLDATEQVLLRANGGPLHAKAIAEALVEYGKKTTPQSIAGSLFQDPKKRFKNIGQNTWELAEK